jgi:hypothetical protein
MREKMVCFRKLHQSLLKNKQHKEVEDGDVRGDMLNCCPASMESILSKDDINKEFFCGMITFKEWDTTTQLHKNCANNCGCKQISCRTSQTFDERCKSFVTPSRVLVEVSRGPLHQ